MISYFIQSCILTCLLLFNITAFASSDTQNKSKDNKVDSLSIQQIWEKAKATQNPLTQLLLFKRSIDYSEEMDWPLGKAKSYHLFAETYNSIEKRDSAIRYFIKSLDVIKKHNLNTDIELNNYISLAQVFIYKQKMDEAFAYAKKGLDYCKQNNYKKKVAYFYHVFGILKFYENNSISSEHYFQMSDSLLNIPAYFDSLLFYNTRINKIAKTILSHNFNEAIQLSNSYLKDHRFNNPESYYNQKIRSLLFVAHLTNENLDSSMYWFNSLKPQKHLLNAELLKYYYGKGAELYYKVGTYDKSWELIHEYIALNDSIYKQTDDFEIGSLVTEYEKNKIINQKEFELTLTKNISKERKKQRNILLVSSLLLLIIILLFITNRLREKRLKKFLFKKNLEVLKQKTTTINPKEHNKTDYNLSISDNDKNMLKEKIEHIMLEERFFLSPDASLPLISEKINSNKSYVSQVFNECLNKKFTDYVNELRILEAQTILNSRENQEKYTIETIGRMVGYTSRSTFYKNFKNYTGLTPKEYIEQMQNQT